MTTRRRAGPRSVRLARGAPAGAAARAIHRALLEQIRVTEEGVRRDLDTECLHDFRVAIRRTRSALGQIRDVLAERTVERFRKEFRWLARKTGPLRDLDVYLEKMSGYRALLPRPVRPDLAPLEALLRSRRRGEREKLVEVLDSGRYAALLEEWEAVIETGDPTPPRANHPVQQVAAERILAARLEVVARGRGIGPQSPARKLHELRIACKKLRYLLEFFGILHDAAAVKRMVDGLKRLQDNLGDFNDLEVQRCSLRELARDLAQESGSVSEKTLAAMDRLVGRLAERQAALRRRFDEVFVAFDTEENRALFERSFATDAGPPRRPRAPARRLPRGSPRRVRRRG